MEDAIEYRWVKKIVDANDPNKMSWYLASPGYTKLDAQGEAGVIAFKFPLTNPKPHHLDWCSPYEEERLEKYQSAFVPREVKKTLLEEAASMFPNAT